MKSTVTKTTITCDLCQSDMPKCLGASEGIPKIVSTMMFSLYYRGDYFIQDICEECNTKLLDILEKEFPAYRLVKL